MKYLYFGTICEHENYRQMREQFRVKPSVAPFVFETALLEGFRENNADLEIISFPVIPTVPRSKHLAWGCRKEKLSSGYSTTWLGTVNIPGLKQMGQRLSSHQLLKKWLRKNADEDKVVLIYSAYQPVSKSIVTLCQKYNTKCFAIIPDLPRDMYSVARIHPVKKALSKFYVRSAERVQGLFSGYIYLTEAMKEVINPTAPFTVVEGIADIRNAEPLTLSHKPEEKAIMYAGALSEKYGLKNLIEAFMQMQDDSLRLWLFGAGDFRQQIEAYAQQDSRICFFGSVPRETVLEYEKKASLLVNVRDSRDAFTKYSFPSKVIEYMLSGTPMFMTKLPGIDEEYYNYTYTAEDNSVQTLVDMLSKICAQSQESLLSFGAKAQNFILQNKNSAAQAKKILDFIHTQQ